MDEYIVGKQIGQGAYATVRFGMAKDSGRKVAIKCIEKAKIRLMEEKIKQRKDKSKLNEHPVKEVHCLSYITRRLNGQLGGPEAIRGDPTRVLPVVDIFEDAHFIFVVMPLMQREFFEVVDERSKGGGRFTGGCSAGGSSSGCSNSRPGGGNVDMQQHMRRSGRGSSYTAASLDVVVVDTAAAAAAAFLLPLLRASSSRLRTADNIVESDRTPTGKSYTRECFIASTPGLVVNQ